MHGLRYLNGILVLVAALVAGGWLWRALGEAPANEGFQVTVEFADARGLRGGADVRCRGVRVGTVLAVAVSKDGNRAVTRMLLQPDAVHLARVDTVFWIVTPRFEGLGSGVSGLDTRCAMPTWHCSRRRTVRLPARSSSPAPWSRASTSRRSSRAPSPWTPCRQATC